MGIQLNRIWRGNNLAPFVPRVDSAIHWITQLVLLLFIRWIVIYPVDSVIHLLNNRGLICSDIAYRCFARHFVVDIENFMSHQASEIRDEIPRVTFTNNIMYKLKRGITCLCDNVRKSSNANRLLIMHTVTWLVQNVQHVFKVRRNFLQMSTAFDRR